MADKGCKVLCLSFFLFSLHSDAPIRWKKVGLSDKNLHLTSTVILIVIQSVCSNSPTAFAAVEIPLLCFR